MSPVPAVALHLNSAPMTQADQLSPILNRVVPHPPWEDPRTLRLPGISPLDMADWLWVLDSYAGQMAERERLLAEAPALVHALPAAAMPAARELYDLVLGQLAARGDFRRDGEIMQCPDGRRVRLDRAAPLLTLGRLVQEDLCLLEKPPGGEEHLLSAAVLCFPASWTLAEKLGRPMVAIHRPVREYDAELARRVQRLLDGVRPERPLWRANRHHYRDFALFHPMREGEVRAETDGQAPYLRSERQCLLRLPQTGAVVFSIHTMLLRRALPPGAVAEEATGAG